MPTISLFYGIIISMRYREHNPPHFHAYYQGQEGLVDIQRCEMTEGNLAIRQKKMVEAWCVIHQDDLIADWTLARDGSALFQIEPLK